MAETVRPAAILHSEKAPPIVQQIRKALIQKPEVSGAAPKNGEGPQLFAIRAYLYSAQELLPHGFIGFPWVAAELRSASGYGELGGEVQENQNYTFYAGTGSEMFSYYA